MAAPWRTRSGARWREPVALAILLAALASVEAEGAEELRFGVVGFYSPRIMFLKYQPVVDYLAEATGNPWQLVISSTYQETVDRLCDGRLTLAYLGPFTYVRAHEQCGALPVVRLDTAGSDTYTSVILVREDSPFRSAGELAGTRFGFGSALSTSSHLVPLAMLREAGVGPGDVTCRFFDHHERAARAVLLGEVEACGVRDLIGDRFVQRGLRVLERSPPIPNFPLVMAPGSDPALRQRIAEVLVERPLREAAVARRMQGWDEEFRSGFAPASDREYAPIRELALRVLGPDALHLPDEELRCGGGMP